MNGNLPRFADCINWGAWQMHALLDKLFVNNEDTLLRSAMLDNTV